VKVGFDPKTETTVGSPIPILKSTRQIRDHQLSPDGQWVAFTTGDQEDLFVARSDGTQFRRLTDDPFRDRGPSWSPDGQTIAFYSDRGGSYQLWTIRPDGSGLERLTAAQGPANFPVWSPDGTRIATKIVPGDWMLISLAAKRSSLMPPVDKAKGFWPFSWAPDGRRLVGALIHPDGTVGGVASYSFETQQYEILESNPGGFRVLAWLSDSRRLLERDRRGISLLDSVTKRTRPLISVGGYAIGVSVGISRDDRWITYTETGTEGDIWLAELK
jgi:WD40 repeat protein